MAPTDATATVVQHVFARLIRDGVLSREIFETIAREHDRQADETPNRRKKVEAMEVADVARFIVILADPPVQRTGLKLVRNEDPPEQD